MSEETAERYRALIAALEGRDAYTDEEVFSGVIEHVLQEIAGAHAAVHAHSSRDALRAAFVSLWDVAFQSGLPGQWQHPDAPGRLAYPPTLLSDFVPRI